MTQLQNYSIRMIKTYDECRDFASGFNGDLEFSDPMLSNEEQLKNNLLKAIAEPKRHCVLGVYQKQQMTGLFVFLVLPDEHYIEMLVGLSRDIDAYQTIFLYLEQNYSSYDADFVLNPRNNPLMEILKKKGAEFEPEQQKMVLGTPVLGMDTTGVELFSAKYAEQYFAIHNKDMYWTGEKVVTAQDKFRTFLAIRDGLVVGYMDVTYCFDENEPYDLFVLENYRGMGYGRKMIAKALEMNQPNSMMLLVDVDNKSAIHIYESLGFKKAENENCITARWKVPAKFDN